MGTDVKITTNNCQFAHRPRGYSRQTCYFSLRSKWIHVCEQGRPYKCQTLSHQGFSRKSIYLWEELRRSWVRDDGKTASDECGTRPQRRTEWLCVAGTRVRNRNRSRHHNVSWLYKWLLNDTLSETQSSLGTQWGPYDVSQAHGRYR